MMHDKKNIIKNEGQGCFVD